MLVFFFWARGTPRYPSNPKKWLLFSPSITLQILLMGSSEGLGALYWEEYYFTVFKSTLAYWWTGLSFAHHVFCCVGLLEEAKLYAGHWAAFSCPPPPPKTYPLVIFHPWWGDTSWWCDIRQYLCCSNLFASKQRVCVSLTFSAPDSPSTGSLQR